MSAHSMIRKHIDALQEQLFGLELIRAAGEAAHKAGNKAGDELFEEYALTGGHDIGVMQDALDLALTWSRTHCAADFASWSNTHVYKTSVGGIAAECVIKYWDDVVPALRPFKEPEMVFPEDEDMEVVPDAEKSLWDEELITEPVVYEMFLRGESPQAVAFQRWVTEEVLPTIRETGKYDHDQTTHSIPKGFFTK